MRSVRISEKDAGLLLTIADCYPHPLAPDENRAKENLRAAMKPKRFVRLAAKRKRAKKATAREQMSAIYEKVAERAGGNCEHCGEPMGGYDPPELDHAFGRRGPQSADTCWMLHRTCHRKKTENRPSAAYWWRSIADHFAWCNAMDSASRAVAHLESLGAIEQAEKLTRGAK